MILEPQRIISFTARLEGVNDDVAMVRLASDEERQLLVNQSSVLVGSVRTSGSMDELKDVLASIVEDQSVYVKLWNGFAKIGRLKEWDTTRARNPMTGRKLVSGIDDDARAAFTFRGAGIFTNDWSVR